MSQEVFFNTDDIIVSKTNLKGHMTYVNDVFCNVSGYTESELMGKPHSLIRHKSMPRCVFKLLWDTISTGNEIFAYVVNSCKNGDYYWVFAHATPTIDTNGNILGYHSNRRVPCPEVVKEKIIPLYKTLLDIEASHTNRKDGLNASFAHLVDILQKAEITYDQFVFSLDPQHGNARNS